MQLHYMATEKQYLPITVGRRELNWFKLSYRIYNRLSKEDKVFLDSLKDRTLIDLVLMAYAHFKKQKGLLSCIKLVVEYRTKLMQQIESQKYVYKLRFLKKQFTFRGFVPLSTMGKISSRNEACYISSSFSILGDTMIFPTRLRMNHRKRDIFYQDVFHNYAIPGYTRVWYPQEVERLTKRYGTEKTTNGI